MKKRMVISVICLCVVLMGGFATRSSGMQGQGANAAAAKSKPAPPPPPPSTSVQFLNQTWAGDVAKITGDGSPYVDGVGGVVCSVTQDPATNCQFLLNLNTQPNPKNPKRRVNYVFDEPAHETTCGGGPALGTISDSGFIAVAHVGDIGIGAPGARLGTFFTNADGYFKFPGGENCSFAVAVLRLDAHTWYVTTDQTYGNPLPNFAGVDHPVGDIAERILFPSGDFAGNYHMPFEMLISCPGCK